MASVLIVGGDGPIGRALASRLREHGDLVTTTTRRPQNVSANTLFFDLADPAPDFVGLPEADVIVIAAAMAKFAECQAQPDLARQVNVLTPLRLAHHAVKTGAHVVLLSTAAVLDGQEPRMKSDRPHAPQSDYGRFKAEAEERLLALGTAVSVLRLTKVLNPETALFVAWINALRSSQPVSAFADLTLAPIALDDAVLALTAVIEAKSGGIYQASGARDISYADCARHLAFRLEADPAMISCGAIAEKGISRADAPSYTSLDTSRLESCSPWRAPSPESVLQSVFGI